MGRAKEPLLRTPLLGHSNPFHTQAAYSWILSTQLYAASAQLYAVDTLCDYAPNFLAVREKN